VWTKFYSVPLNVPQGQTQVTFTHVEDDLTFAIPPSKDVSNYVIYVGYDPQSAAAGAKTAKKKPSETQAAAKSKPKSKAQPAVAGPQPMTPASAQPTFAPAPQPGQFAPPPRQPTSGSNG
jgi:hypothetical protein